MINKKSGNNRPSNRCPDLKSEVRLLPSGVFITACCVLHGFEGSPFTKQQAKLLVDGFLNAASEAGYARTEVLAALIADNNLGGRMREMCREAVDKIPDQVIAAMYRGLGLEYSMGNRPFYPTH